MLTKSDLQKIGKVVDEHLEEKLKTNSKKIRVQIRIQT